MGHPWKSYWEVGGAYKKYYEVHWSLVWVTKDTKTISSPRSFGASTSIRRWIKVMPKWSLLKESSLRAWLILGRRSWSCGEITMWCMRLQQLPAKCVKQYWTRSIYSTNDGGMRRPITTDPCTHTYVCASVVILYFRPVRRRDVFFRMPYYIIRVLLCTHVIAYIPSAHPLRHGYI